MPLFQKTILAKYLQAQDKAQTAEKWNIYKRHFLNPLVQANIIDSKEEQYQEGFLRDLFVKIFGYTLNPEANFNLTTELKNVKDSKKVDGAIILPSEDDEGKVIGVIELKSAKTTDLGKVETQAFGYKNNQKDCVYVITSNFEKLRLYIDNAVEHIEFNLFKLTEKEFEVLYLCLAFENIKKGLTKKLKDDSLHQEDVITKQLYKDYSEFKQALYLNMVANNPQFEYWLLFKKTQKLLDRFLFIFFAEDRNLLQNNSIRMITKFWKSLKNWEDYKPLYTVFQKFFHFLNNGIKNEELDIFPYNGGLFAPDEVLDYIKIDDDILYTHTLKLSEYDFLSEVDVNILGHIFENSLDEVPPKSPPAPEGGVFTPSPLGRAGVGLIPPSGAGGLRKKDGVFYTPKYITKYIVENTVGKLCNEQKNSLQIIDNEYFTDKKRKKQDTQILLDKLKIYRDWLLGVTIIDPACGSGAFLNEALNFLIAEHAYIDELQAKLFGDTLVLSDVEKSILENNLFGVDLNEESVEIAKLSLWLRTARPGRRLNDLNNNIKCGNSLIDSPEIAGEKAFDWHKEFPHIFKNGGFDVVIGNPPYVRGRELEEDERRYLDKFGISSNDLAILFMQKAFELTKNNGIVSYIVPKSLLYASNWDTIRERIAKHLYRLIDCGKVWNEVLLEQVIFALTKEIRTDYKTGYREGEEITELDTISNVFATTLQYLPARETANSLKIALKIKNNSISLNDVYENIAGVPYQKHINGHGDFEMIGGAEFDRFTIKGTKGKIEKQWVQSNNALIKTNTLLVQNIIAHILYPNAHIKITACVPLAEHIGKIALANTVNQLVPKENNEFEIANKYTWCILNSKLINWYVYRFVFAFAIRTMHFYNPISEKVPFIVAKNQQPFIEKADEILSLHKELQKVSDDFKLILDIKLDLTDLSNKLQNWYLLTYKEFLKELEKKKINFTNKDKTEWQKDFEEAKQPALDLHNKIQQTDKEIDAMVYDLYELTEEEIKIVENGK